MVLLSTHNICFGREIRKIIFGYTHLSGGLINLFIDGETDSRCGLMKLIEASTEVEKLLEDNKYFCEECKCYVEAERSMLYDVMPDILTLHLKRFCATSG